VSVSSDNNPFGTRTGTSLIMTKPLKCSHTDYPDTTKHNDDSVQLRATGLSRSQYTTVTSKLDYDPGVGSSGSDSAGRTQTIHTHEV
jgi:hypothetical protein